MASLAPCTLNSVGILRSSSTFLSLSAPSFANLLLSSFPGVPLWPLTHVKVVLADLLLSRCAAFLNRLVFFFSVQPWSSHFARCLVRLSMMYLKSDPLSRSHYL